MNEVEDMVADFELSGNTHNDKPSVLVPKMDAIGTNTKVLKRPYYLVCFVSSNCIVRDTPRI